MILLHYFRETQTDFKINNIYFSENRNVNKQMWKNVVDPGRPQVTVSVDNRFVSAVYDHITTTTPTKEAFPLQPLWQQKSNKYYIF